MGGGPSTGFDSAGFHSGMAESGRNLPHVSCVSSPPHAGKSRLPQGSLNTHGCCLGGECVRSRGSSRLLFPFLELGETEAGRWGGGASRCISAGICLPVPPSVRPSVPRPRQPRVTPEGAGAGRAQAAAGVGSPAGGLRAGAAAALPTRGGERGWGGHPARPPPPPPPRQRLSVPVPSPGADGNAAPRVPPESWREAPQGPPQDRCCLQAG